MKVVLDTNVIVSGLLSPNGTPAAIMNLFLNDKIIILYDNRIIQEYQNVLNRPKFKFEIQTVSSLIEFIKHNGEYVIPEPVSIKFKDQDDIPFYEVACTGKADFLRTGNLKHFPKSKDFEIVSPADFLKK